jgi:tRNA pseudouridine55 synthase
MERLGLVNICKLPGMSSHEVVARVRRIAGMKRVGHTGTLDPVAAGVLPICLGNATRLAEYIAEGPKTYRAEFLFGLGTDSHDMEGQVVARADASGLTADAVAAALPGLSGTYPQRPPAHSAVQVGGIRAYDLVRRGHDVELKPRVVTVYTFTAVAFTPGPQARLLADLTVSKGTYIRALARDLGDAVGVPAMLSFLGRLQVGDCLLADALTLDEVAAAADAGALDACIRTPDSALTHIPALTIPATAAKYRLGVVQTMDGEPGLYRIYQRGYFMGLGRLEEGRLRPVVNLYPLPGDDAYLP